MAKIAHKTGPEPDRLKIEGGWEKAAAKLATTPKPAGGFKKPRARKRSVKKAKR